MKVLVVEDNQILLQMYHKLLQNHGYEVKTAVNGEEGLNAALVDHPDLILLDLRMPVMDGMEMMHKLRSDQWGSTASIIILTNLEPNDERLKSVIEDQPSYYLVKANNTPEQILEKVKDVLDKKIKS